MVDYFGYDRPNTVAGLVAKHAELTALRERHKAEIKKLTVDIHDSPFDPSRLENFDKTLLAERIN